MVDHSFAKVHTLKRTATRGVHYEDGVPQGGGLATRHPSSNKPISLRLDQEKMTSVYFKFIDTYLAVTTHSNWIICILLKVLHSPCLEVYIYWSYESDNASRFSPATAWGPLINQLFQASLVLPPFLLHLGVANRKAIFINDFAYRDIKAKDFSSSSRVSTQHVLIFWNIEDQRV